MPWTKTNYPVSMKNLPAGVRNKAIEIANAMLKGNKKMNEGIIIATSVKNAKNLAVKAKKKTTVAPEKKKKVAIVKKVVKAKSKSSAAKKVKSPVKGKATIAVEKTVKRPLKTKATIAVKKKVKSQVKIKTKSITVKKINTPSKAITKKSSVVKKTINPAPNKTKSIVKKEINKSSKEKVEIPVTVPAFTHEITHGEDLHFIPEHNPTAQMITPVKAHEIENVFHHREEVAFHQENQKVKNAMPSRKNAKKTYRMKGKR